MICIGFLYPGIAGSPQTTPVCYWPFLHSFLNFGHFVLSEYDTSITVHASSSPLSLSKSTSSSSLSLATFRVADRETSIKIGLFYLQYLPLHLLRSARVRCFLVVLQNWLFLFCWISAFFATRCQKRFNITRPKLAYRRDCGARIQF